jgi:tetratricopeptide (TPR) repeat protein
MNMVVGLLGLIGVGAFFYVLKALEKRLYAYLTLGISLLLIAIGLNPGFVIGIGTVGVVGSIISLGIVWGRRNTAKAPSTVFKVFPAVAIGVSLMFLFIGGGTLSHKRMRSELDKTYKAGLDAYHAHEFESAVNLLTKVQATHRGVDTLLQRIPGEAFAYCCGAGQEALASGSYDRAMESFRSAVKWDPRADSLVQKVRDASYRHYYSAGVEALGKEDFGRAAASFRSALNLKPNDTYTVRLLADAEARLDERLSREGRKAEEARRAAVEKKDEAKVEAAAREEYQKLARNHFLDQGWDIDVLVNGPQNKYITLTWVWIDDVFVHDFRKSEMIREMRQLGFRRVYFKDGLGYSEYVHW